MFVHGQPFQPSLLFVGKTRNLPYSGAPERFFNRVGSFFTSIHQLGWKGLPGNKHSSLLRQFINYGRKKFYNIDTMSYLIDRLWVGSLELQLYLLFLST
jgi:hypothetical protein